MRNNIIKDITTQKYIEEFQNHEKALESINKIYQTIFEIVIFNKDINEHLENSEFEYIYDLRSNLEILEEDFENHIYDPNFSDNLNTIEKVYTYRKKMVDDIKNKLNIIINKKNFNI